MQGHAKVFLLRIAGILLLIFAGCFVYRYGYWIYLWAKDGEPCQHRSRIVSQNRQGDRVEFAEDFCAGPAFSNAGTLSLISGGESDPQRFFFYQENGGDPVVSWTGSDHLVVKIDRLEEIYVQKPMIGNVDVQYDIGEVSVDNRR